MPPKIGHRRFEIPSARSSLFGSWRVPVMPSATTAASSDSIAPSIAMANADGRSAWMVAKSRCAPGILNSAMGNGGSGGMPATSWPLTVEWKREPMVATLNPGQKWWTTVVTIATSESARSGAGIFLMTRGSRIKSASVTAPTASSAGWNVECA